MGNKIQQHGCDDKVVAICIVENIKMQTSSVEAVRLFVRCFSIKCEVRTFLLILLQDMIYDDIWVWYDGEHTGDI